MSALTDKSPMPFGKYNGQVMEDVPARYLLWLYDSMIKKAPNKRNLSEKYLITYIEDNKKVLEKQAKEEQ